MKWNKLTCAIIAASCLGACSAAELEYEAIDEDPGVQAEALATKPGKATPTRPSSPKIASGKAIADRMFEVVNANSTLPWPELAALLGPEVTAFQALNLSDAEAAVINEYVHLYGPDWFETLFGDDGGGGGGGGEGNPLPEGACFAWCAGVVLLRCGTNQPVGMCFGAWNCTALFVYDECYDPDGGDDDEHCDDDDDCPPDEYCADGLLDFGPNVCRPDWPNGTNCSDDDQCESDCCNFNAFGSECAAATECN